MYGDDIIQSKIKGFDIRNHSFDASNYEKIKDFPYKLNDLCKIADDMLHIGDKILYQQTIVQIENCIRVILSTGNGLSWETGFIVNCVGDEYYLLYCLGLSPKGKQSVYTVNTTIVDQIDICPNKYNIESIYFNITNMMLHRRREVLELFNRECDNNPYCNDDIIFEVGSNKNPKKIWRHKMN